MDIVVEVRNKDLYPNSIVPSGLISNVEELSGDSIDGETLILIYSIAKEVISIGANIAAIAGFIYVLKNDYKAKVSVGNEVIDSSDDQGQIVAKLEKAASDTDPTIEQLKE